MEFLMEFIFTLHHKWLHMYGMIFLLPCKEFESVMPQWQCAVKPVNAPTVVVNNHFY